MDTVINPTSKEAVVGEMAYTLKTPELFTRLNLKPMDIVRKTGVSVAMAYTLADEDSLKEKGDTITLDTAWKVYTGLRKSGFSVVWEDVVEFQENGAHE